jgi:AraC-like DNA-binding protein
MPPLQRLTPSASLASIVESLWVSERHADTPLVGLPRPEIDLVVRFGPAASGGLDVHARGASERVLRKHVRGVQRTVSARFRLGAAESVLGVPATAIAGRVASLDALWGEADARRLHEQLGEARDGLHAAAVLDAALAARIAKSPRAHGGALAQRAAHELRDGASAEGNVRIVAGELGVSERHLRRVFRDAFGVGPKTFARLARFERAVRDARRGPRTGWASIAASAGYYDQAHLIAEFRAIAGVTPKALLGELQRTSVLL